MEKLTPETKKLMDERFGHDCIIALATMDDGLPHVRNVDAYYEDGILFSHGTRYDIDFTC